MLALASIENVLDIFGSIDNYREVMSQSQSMAKQVMKERTGWNDAWSTPEDLVFPVSTIEQQMNITLFSNEAGGQLSSTQTAVAGLSVFSDEKQLINGIINLLQTSVQKYPYDATTYYIRSVTTDTGNMEGLTETLAHSILPEDPSYDSLCTYSRVLDVLMSYLPAACLEITCRFSQK
jgi:hypothetical protein